MGMSKHTRSRRSSDMSQKLGRRQKKKSDAELDQQSMEQKPEESKPATNGSQGNNENGDDSDLKGFTMEEVEEASSTNQNETTEAPAVSQKETSEETNEIVEENNVTESEVAKVQQNEDNAKLNDSHESQDIEPLVLDFEEPDPELQFDEGSDKESLKGSPFGRCKTRRSQVRNIPTPKTPKSTYDQNGDDKEDSDKHQISTIAEKFEENEVDRTETPENSSEAGSSFLIKNTESDSMENLSTRAVAGDDLTAKDLDLTMNDVPLRANMSDPLINPYKEKTLAETLRGISSRRTIRSGNDYRKYAIKSNMEKSNLNFERPVFAARSSVERVSGIKRKNDSESPERAKKCKPDSPGLLSYITSPIGQLKSRFLKSDLPSSTPKLTSYKSQSDAFENVDVSKIENNEEDVKQDNGKWCSIM